ncbi:helix-turn-helix transcriptional regulator [Niabella drilacis]|uniref:AraC-type DNA-binding protein n=1 Tax=Niabella drilacis (strain DSM 25811 / CCM 8410 / CCUG 62505 / LMG 26954 / E90) TaxID=1285928 RepID=A0A1G6MUA2_NIADE|nr:AraC family transcriptional regulator [Niabella drilacis]SDC59092.1 AraC-type DNA-binding protein [Niabella drilacis]
MAVKKTGTIAEYHLNRHEPGKLPFALYDLNEYLQLNQVDATRPHIHSFYQVIWFKSGSGTHFVDFKAYEVTPDTLFFIEKNQVHYFDMSSNYQGVLIHFNELFLKRQDNEMDFLVKCDLFHNWYRPPCCKITGPFDAVLEEHIRQIKIELQHTEAFGSDLLLNLYLKALLIQVQRERSRQEQHTGKKPFAMDEKRMQLLQFVNLLNDHYHKGLKITDYAQLMHISTRTLSELTGQILAKTPSLMIQERMILEAQRLLLHSHLNINQVGYRLGFDDPSYFVKYFKKHTQMSPSEFRRSVT